MRRFVIFISVVLSILNNISAFSQEIKSDDINNQVISEKPIIYGSDTCHYCLETKTFLKKNNTLFVYYDVDRNTDKEKEMIMKLKAAKIPLSNLNLPVIDKGGFVFINDGKFEEFLKRIIE